MQPLELLEHVRRLVSEFPHHAQIEDARFMLAVVTAQIALATPIERRRLPAMQARTALSEFQRLYPDSLRSSATAVLLEQLPH